MTYVAAEKLYYIIHRKYILYASTKYLKIFQFRTASDALYETKYNINYSHRTYVTSRCSFLSYQNLERNTLYVDNNSQYYNPNKLSCNG